MLLCLLSLSVPLDRRNPVQSDLFSTSMSTSAHYTRPTVKSPAKPSAKASGQSADQPLIKISVASLAELLSIESFNRFFHQVYPNHKLGTLKNDEDPMQLHRAGFSHDFGSLIEDCNRLVEADDISVVDTSRNQFRNTPRCVDPTRGRKCPYDAIISPSATISSSLSQITRSKCQICVQWNTLKETLPRDSKSQTA